MAGARIALRKAVCSSEEQFHGLPHTGVRRGAVNSHQESEDHGTALCNVTTPIIGLHGLCVRSGATAEGTLTWTLYTILKLFKMVVEPNYECINSRRLFDTQNQILPV